MSEMHTESWNIDVGIKAHKQESLVYGQGIDCCNSVIALIPTSPHSCPRLQFLNLT